MTHGGAELASGMWNPFPILLLGFVAGVEHDQSVVERLQKQSEGRGDAQGHQGAEFDGSVFIVVHIWHVAGAVVLAPPM